MKLPRRKIAHFRATQPVLDLLAVIADDQEESQSSIVREILIPGIISMLSSHQIDENMDTINKMAEDPRTERFVREVITRVSDH